ncbi:MAG: hypothetical protein ACI361_08205 [Atopobiaceae bacterium]
MSADRRSTLTSSRFQTTFSDIVCTVEHEHGAFQQEQEEDGDTASVFDISIDLADLAVACMPECEDAYSGSEKRTRATSIDAGEFICIQDEHSLSIGIRSPESKGTDAVEQPESWIRISWDSADDGSCDLTIDISSAEPGEEGPAPFRRSITS